MYKRMYVCIYKDDTYLQKKKKKTKKQKTYSKIMTNHKF